MSILIKGMAMPKNCMVCNFGVGGTCVAMGQIRTRDWRAEKTSEHCPLVELPPHGRLIDERWLKDAMATTLEALIKNPKMDAQEMHIIAAFDTLREMIDDAPTIIESEGEE